jgi:predicted RNase H-like HicB family nuclease
MTRPRYLIEIFWSDEDAGWIAVAPDLPGCSAFGETPAEALREMEDAMGSWLQACASLGRPQPDARARPRQAA